MKSCRKSIFRNTLKENQEKTLFHFSRLFNRQSIKGFLPRNRQALICLKKIDLEGISRLLDSGFPLVQCLELLEDKTNHEAFKLIKTKLSEGYAISEFIEQIIPQDLKSHMISFLQFLPLSESIKLSLKLNEYDHSTRYQLVKSLAAPLLMLAGCLAGIWLFSVLCFPLLIEMMQDFNLELGWIKTIGVLINCISAFILCITLLSMIIILFFIQPKRIVMGYILLCRMHLAKPVRHFLSTQFAVYFNECVKLGNSTQATLNMLQKIKSKPLIVFLGYHVEQALLEGKTMEEAMGHQYLDTSLRRFMQIAIHSSSLKEMLISYIQQNEEKGKALCKKWTNRITVLAYGSIGILIVLIYQILLLPLSIIGQV